MDQVQKSDFDIELSKSPYRTIWKLSWPQIAMMVFHFFIGFVDVIVAGRLDKSVQASLGVITQLYFFLMVVAISVANGSVAAISQSIGAGLYKRVKRYVGLCLTLAWIFGLLFMGLGLVSKGLLLNLLHIPETILPVAEYFLDVYMITLPTYYMLVILNAVFRAQKRVMIPLYSGMIITTMNTVLDIGLGFGMWGMPHMGYKGLAWATFASVSAGSLFSLTMLRKYKLLDRQSFAPLRWIKAATPYLVKVSWPGALHHIVWHLGYLALYAIVASLPAVSVNALAGMTAGIRIESMLFLPGFGFSMTASILTGHYLGAGRPDEAKAFALKILGLGVASMSIVAVVVWHYIEPIAAFVAPDAGVQAETMSYLFWNFLALPFTLAAMILSGVFGGAGATLYNLLIFGSAAWGIRVPLAYIMGHMAGMGPDGVWISMLISMVAQAVVMVLFFVFKKWDGYSMYNNRRNNRSAQNAAI